MCSRWVLTVASLTKSLAVGGAVGDQGQHLQLTLAEDLGWRLADLAHQPAGDRRGEDGLAGERRPDGPDQLLPGRVLEQVPGRSGLEGPEDLAPLHGEGQVVHRDLVAVPLVQVFHLDDRHVGLPPRS
jgi:hypothetical protein